MLKLAYRLLTRYNRYIGACLEMQISCGLIRTNPKPAYLYTVVSPVISLLAMRQLASSLALALI